MRWLSILALAVVVMAPVARAGDEIKPEQLKKMYDEAVVQLQSAQDRKNELAMENEKLKARIGELEKQVETAKANEASFAERTYQWRATHAAWLTFLRRYPNLLGKWQAFMAGDVMESGSLPDWDADGVVPVASK
jgi:hypothetical protein